MLLQVTNLCVCVCVCVCVLLKDISFVKKIVHINKSISEHNDVIVRTIVQSNPIDILYRLRKFG
jgi:hypothetical protein